MILPRQYLLSLSCSQGHDVGIVCRAEEVLLSHQAFSGGDMNSHREAFVWGPKYADLACRPSSRSSWH